MQYTVNAAIKRLQAIVDKNPEIGDAILGIDVFDRLGDRNVAYDIDIEPDNYNGEEEGGRLFIIFEHDYDDNADEDEDFGDFGW